MNDTEKEKNILKNVLIFMNRASLEGTESDAHVEAKIYIADKIKILSEKKTIKEAGVKTE